MSCVQNEDLRERLFENYYELLIKRGMTHEQVLAKLDEMFCERLK
tara:strand:- start:280 stop:414 length:135 start_codon:yes stop_codon:yes gene_type:complete